MKYTYSLLPKIVCLVTSGWISVQSLSAQDLTDVDPRVEIRFAIALQRPKFISAYDPGQLLVIKQNNRYRGALSLGLRYYVASHWFAEYQLSFSGEGGGYSRQFTNTSYLKNSLFVGWSARHRHRMILGFYTGLDFNYLLGAKFQAVGAYEQEKVTTYFKRLHFSVPLGIGLKTKVVGNTYLGLQAFVQVGLNNLSNQSPITAYPVLWPAFKFTFSKIIP